MLTLARLPLSSLLFSLALFVSAAPAQTAKEARAVSLNPDNFQSSTANGIWFVEFFSPYCVHCRGFRPTWELLVEEFGKTPDSPLTLAQVNCAVYGDLCRQLDIDGYPSLNLYQDGKYIDTFNQARELDYLLAFLSAHTLKSAPPLVVQDTPSEPPPPIINLSGEVLVLSNQNFVEEMVKGKIFVKFFAPWCGHCKKLAPTWTLLADQMKNQLTIAEVDCEAHSSICKSQDIGGYPTLIYYGADGAKTEYTGGRKLPQLNAFVEKVTSPAVQRIAFDSFHAHVQTNDVMFLLLHSPSETQSSTLVIKASTVLLGSPPVFESDEESMANYLKIPLSSLPVLIAFKDNDALKPAATMSLQPTDGIDSIKAWLLRHRLPTALPLDSDNFPQVMSPKDMIPPLVLIAAVSEKNAPDSMEKLKRIGKKWKDGRVRSGNRDVIFAWMSAEKWSTWLKSMYGIAGAENAETPPVVIADHNRLVYYDVDSRDEKITLTSASIESALEGILDGSIGYKHSQNVIERLVQSLNDKLDSLGSFITHHPWFTTFLGLSACVIFVLFMRRALADSGSESYTVKNGRYEKLGNGYNRKSTRSD